MIASSQQIGLPDWLYVLLIALTALSLGYWFVHLFHWFMR
jgi:hypothetical protein